MAEVSIDLGVVDLAVVLVEARGVQLDAAGPELRQTCDEASAAASTGGSAGGDGRRQAVRDLLRRGGYKPSGRSKPAQEYLLRTVRDEGGLPSISNAVDLINLVSLRSGLPISLVALDRVGSRLLLRYGRAGEAYVFNRSGQQLDVQGLLCLCSVEGETSQPVGSPVKDSMRGKVQQSDKNLLACIFAPRAAIDPAELQVWADELVEGFRRFCGAAQTSMAILSGEE